MSSFSWSQPDTLKNTLRNIWQKCDGPQRTQFESYFGDNPETQAQLHQTLTCSVFFANELERRPKLFCELLERNELDTTFEEKDYLDHCPLLDNNDSTRLDEPTFDKALRELRAQSMLRIIWRDFNRIADFNETTNDLSYLAKATINSALNFHYTKLEERHGTPRCKNGKAQPLLILAMGKLGAQELNLSSDIDLIFGFPESGATDGKRDLTNQEFFTRLGKKIIQSLDAITSDGFVFRVDMRLRPYGQSGALVYSFSALEEYYLTQGREWERYAMVKASVIANNGDAAYSEQLMQMLHEFTYRKYVDFSVIESLRGLKQMITQEVERRGLHNDVKLGSGGIREVEFTAQVFQLIRGGRDIELQNNRLLEILPQLAELNCLPQEQVASLTKAYLFLRNSEHAIQGYRDEQTQKLPDNEDAQLALAKVMSFETWEKYLETLTRHRDIVKNVFSGVIAAPEEQEESDEGNNKSLLALWNQRFDRDTAISQFETLGHEAPDLSFSLLEELEQWASVSSMHSTSRERLDRFMPMLLQRLQEYENPTEITNRLVKLIKSIARRSAYLLLLIENPDALSQLLRLVSASPWVAATMAEHPALLDELLNPESLYHPPEKHELQAELQRATLRIAPDDLEAQMESLRYFRSSHALRVAASEISGALPLMKVSDYLTWIGEAILDYVLTLCWNGMVEKHGYPDGEEREQPNFIIVGYGKLGGIELGHGSDLDLVFIHGAKLNGSTSGDANGKRSLDNQTFYMRLGQKIIHFITTKMNSGDLYEVDMRLRPSGNSGMLVASLSSFEKYQHESAWTWEHQAIVRARPVAGDSELIQRFNDIRQNVLSKQRELPTLQQDVVEMREKMREHLGSDQKDVDKFHLKQDAGGIVDIEFMVQYAVLAWAHSHPELLRYTDNIRILESLEQSNLLDTQEVSQLIDAYKAFRTVGHRRTLQQLSNVIDASELTNERTMVSSLWQKMMLNG